MGPWVAKVDANAPLANIDVFYLPKEPKVPTKLAIPKVQSSVELEAPKVDALVALVNPCNPWVMPIVDWLDDLEMEIKT